MRTGIRDPLPGSSRQRQAELNCWYKTLRLAVVQQDQTEQWAFFNVLSINAFIEQNAFLYEMHITRHLMPEF